MDKLNKSYNVSLARESCVTWLKKLIGEVETTAMYLDNNLELSGMDTKESNML